MKKLIGAVLCILALSVAVLPAAYGMEHVHDGAKLTKSPSLDEGRIGAHSNHDPAALNHCEIVPGHCSVIATPGTANVHATHYVSSSPVFLLDDEAKPKHRPETELRPPRV